MAKYLATYSDTINDIEITGFNVMTDNEMERFEELAESITWDFVYQVGEAELEFSSGEDLLSRIDFREISNEEYKALNKVFEDGFGTFINEDYLLDIIGDEEEESELDEDEDDGYRSTNEDDEEY